MGGKKVYFRLRRRRAIKQMKQIIPTESQEQVAFMQWVDMFFNGNEEFVFAIPNGGLRNVVVAKKMKAEGVKPGVPDLFFTLARGGYHGLFIEMKRIKGGSTSKDQKDKIERLRNCGYKVDVCKGFDEAKKSILEYVSTTPELKTHGLVR